MKLTDQQRKMGRDFLKRLDQSRVDRGNAILREQEAMRKAHPEPSEEQVRALRETDWN